MPSFKTAGKSKQDLIVVAQLAGLLTAEEAAGKTRLQLVRLINAASKDAEANGDNSTAGAKATATDHDVSMSDKTTENQNKDLGRKTAAARKRTAAASTAGKTATRSAARKSTAKKASSDESEVPTQEISADQTADDAMKASEKKTSVRKSTRKATTSAASSNAGTSPKSKTAAKTTRRRSAAKNDAADDVVQTETPAQQDGSGEKKTRTKRRTTRKPATKAASGIASDAAAKVDKDAEADTASDTRSDTTPKKQRAKTRTGRKRTTGESGDITPEPVKTTESSKTSKAVKTTESSKTAEAAKTTESVKTAETAKTKESIKAVKTDKFTEAAESTRQTDAAKAVDSGKTVKTDSQTKKDNKEKPAADDQTSKKDQTSQDDKEAQDATSKPISETDAENQTKDETKDNPVKQVIAKKAEEKQSVIKFVPKTSLTKKVSEAKTEKASDIEETSPEAAAAGLEQDASSSSDQVKSKPEKVKETEQPVNNEKEEQHRQQNRPSHKNGQTTTQDNNRSKRPQVEAGEVQSGVLEIMPDGYGFLRRDNYLQGAKDIYVPPQYIRRFSLRQGDYVTGPVKLQRESDRYQALLYIKEVNGLPPEKMQRRPNFDRLTPIYPDERFKLESTRNELSTRIIDLVAPIGKGQRGMIVSPPKAGKTILLQKIANAISQNNPDAKLIVLLIDERPEEVTDMQRSINGEVVYSTFDKTPENHTKVVELVLERAMRLVELNRDVVILLDSMTRLARAYNLTINPTGRTLSGGLDPGALYGPKRFFGAARNIENGGSLTIIATSLIETGSRMDEVIFEEFKGTGNMEVYLDRKLSEKRIFPAIDINKSGTRREDLLLSEKELDAAWNIRKAFSQLDTAAVTEAIIGLLLKTQNNDHFIASVNVSFNDKNLYDAMRGKGGPGQQQGGGQTGGNGYKNGNGGSTGYRQ